MSGPAHSPLKIAVFYHCILSGDKMPGDGTPLAVFTEQMTALQCSGLAEAAKQIHCCVSGSDSLLAATLAPDKALIHPQPDKGDGERPTINFLHQWSKQHPGWAVCYHHMKGASLHGDVYGKWRRCMERAVIWNWASCYADICAGIQTVGAHWIDPQKNPIGGTTGYWGGNFWWAKSDFLSTLPALPNHPDTNGKCYWAELWIGGNRIRPLLKDYAPHWPQRNCA